MGFQNNFKPYNFKIMKIKKALIILAIFMSYTLKAQEVDPINTIFNNASIGVNIGLISDLSDITDNITHQTQIQQASPQQVQLQQPQTTQNEPTSPRKDVVATARGVFDYNGGVLSSLETGVSLVIPEGAIPYGTQQEIYFKVCHDENALPSSNGQNEKLMSPMVMCGPHGLKFDVPIELRLPHRPERDPHEMNLTASQPDEDSVSILIDHF
jgi:tight junction protein 1